MRAVAVLAGMMGLGVFGSGCALLDDLQRSSAERRAERARNVVIDAAAAEHGVYRSVSGWKKSTYRNEALLEQATPEITSVQISLKEQRGLLLVDGAIAMDFPVATGKASHPTPEGEYKIRAMKARYASNLYGKIYDSEGNVTVSDADSRKHAVPEGGRFVGASMPYWMRLTDRGVGMHVGYVPGRPASHGCIRLKLADAKKVFALSKVGTPVVIAQSAPVLAEVE